MPISCTYVPQKLLFTRQLHGLPLRGSSFLFSFPFRGLDDLSFIKVIQSLFLSAEFFSYLLSARFPQGNAKCQAPAPFTPCAAWNLPLLQVVSVASVSIATVQALTPQSGPRLLFGATLLVPCPLCIPAKPYLPVSRSGTAINWFQSLIDRS